MGLDNFEKELFNSLGNFESNLNLELEWDALESKLPTKKNDKPGLFILLGFIYLLVGCTSLYITYLHLDTTGSNTLSEINQTNTLNNKDQIKATTLTAESINTSSNEGEIEKKEESLSNVVENQTNIGTKKATNAAPKANSAKTKSNRAQRESFTASSTTKKSVQKQFLSENWKTSTAVNQPVSILQNPVGTQKATPIFKAITPAKTRLASRDLLQANFLTNLFLSLNYKRALIDGENLKLTPFEKNYGDEIQNSNWRLGLAYGYGLNSFNRTSDSELGQYTIDRFEPYEEAVDNVSIKLKAYRTIHKNVSFFAGIGVSQQTNVFKLNDSFEIFKDSTEVLVEQTFYLNGAVEEVYNVQSGTATVTVDAKLWQKYRSLSIPLGISFHSDLTKSFSIQSDFSAEITPFQSISGNKILWADDGYTIFENKSYNPKLFSSISNQTTMLYNVNSRWSFFGGIDIGMDLNSRIDPQEHYNMKFSYFGLSTGVCYKL